MKSRIIKLILVAAAIVGILLLISEPNHGRDFTIPLIDGMVIQADPPAKKLLKYMEKKYNREFVQVFVEQSRYLGEC